MARIGLFSARFVGLLLLAVLSLLYIAQSSQGATKHIELQSLKSKADELTHTQDQLRLEALRLQSLDTLSHDTESLQLEPVTSVEYLKK